jgi:hypothetical protein
MSVEIEMLAEDHGNREFTDHEDEVGLDVEYGYALAEGGALAVVKTRHGRKDRDPDKYHDELVALFGPSSWYEVKGSRFPREIPW